MSIKDAERRGDLHGVKICNGAHIITHLLSVQGITSCDSFFTFFLSFGIVSR